MKKALVCGAGGFIGTHMVERLKKDGYWVRGIDLKYPVFTETIADDFVIADLRDPCSCMQLIDQKFDEVYQFAADMGGAGYVFVGTNDADIMHNSALINLNVLEYCSKRNIKNIFYSSSACVYPDFNPSKGKDICIEESVYPANPDSEYGWEKIFSERVYLAYNKNKKINVRVGRYHNIYGPFGAWNNGKEKAPAAICRKVATLNNGDEIEIWGDGDQKRSFLFIDDCIEATLLLMRSNWATPINIGSEEMISINKLVDIISGIEGKKLKKKYVEGPVGVQKRNSNNRLIEKILGWKPKTPLKSGLYMTYDWIKNQLANNI